MSIARAVEPSRFSSRCNHDDEFPGAPDRALVKLEAGRRFGIEAFLGSGPPHATGCDRFARRVPPRLDHGPHSPSGGHAG